MDKKILLIFAFLATFFSCSDNITNESLSTVNENFIDYSDYEKAGILHNEALNALYSSPRISMMDDISQFSFLKNYVENSTGESVNITLEEVNGIVSEYSDLDFISSVEKLHSNGIITDVQKAKMLELENIMLMTDENMFAHRIKGYIENLESSNELSEEEKAPILMFSYIAKHSSEFWAQNPNQYFSATSRNHTVCHSCWQINRRELLRLDGIGGLIGLVNCLLSGGFVNIGPCLGFGAGAAVVTSGIGFLILCGSSCF